MIKCFICNERFANDEDYKTRTSASATSRNASCLKLGNNCHTYSNVPSGFIDRRDSFPQFTYPIIGPAESGKSYYLHTITQNLVDMANKEIQFLLNKFQINVSPIHGYESSRIIDLRNTLRRSPLLGTVASAEENNIPIVLHCQSGRGVKQKSADLCFFDLAGTLFHDNNKFMDDDTRISNANGLLIFIDPFQDAVLNDLLHPDIKADRIINDASRLIQRLARLPRRSRLVNKIDIPIAFCLSMFDLLEHLVPDEFPELYIKINDLYNSKANGLNIEHINKTSALIEEFLVAKQSQIPVSFIKKNFQNYKWFAVSTIGHNDINNKPTSIHSKGIYSPLFWLLHNNDLVS